jgi:hypothetical protein
MKGIEPYDVSYGNFAQLKNKNVNTLCFSTKRQIHDIQRVFLTYETID